MTPQSWNNILAPTVGWKTAYAAVEEEVRRVFSSEHATGKLTTSLLVELLYPQAEARGPAGLAARARLFTALAALADHGLKDYWELDTPRPMKRNPAKTIRPKLWRKPVERYSGFAVYCPTLNRLDPVQAAQAIHRAFLQLRAIEDTLSNTGFDNGPALAGLRECLRIIGHPAGEEPNNG